MSLYLTYSGEKRKENTLGKTMLLYMFYVHGDIFNIENEHLHVVN